MIVSHHRQHAVGKSQNQDEEKHIDLGVHRHDVDPGFAAQTEKQQIQHGHDHCVFRFDDEGRQPQTEKASEAFGGKNRMKADMPPAGDAHVNDQADEERQNLGRKRGIGRPVDAHAEVFDQNVIADDVDQRPERCQDNGKARMPQREQNACHGGRQGQKDGAPDDDGDVIHGREKQIALGAQHRHDVVSKNVDQNGERQHDHEIEDQPRADGLFGFFPLPRPLVVRQAVRRGKGEQQAQRDDQPLHGEDGAQGPDGVGTDFIAHVKRVDHVVEFGDEIAENGRHGEAQEQRQ